MSDYEGEERRSKQAWRLKKDISIPDIISFASAVLAVIYAYTSLDKRVYAIEQVQIAQKVVDQRQDEDSIRQQIRIETQLEKLNSKLDRIVERR